METVESTMIQTEENETVNYTSHELTEKQKRYLPVKRVIDLVLGGCASIVLSPVMGVLALAIKMDSPGPVLFKQKRIGKDKELFEIWKFRTMRTDTPKDMPTHMLGNPDAYITRTGRVMRKLSLDELPQIWQIARGQMSIIGPRPALWNQYDLIAERDKYGANSVIPGLTGWAQINGRDELEIPVKAKFDGEYVEKIGFAMDLKCFLGTIGSVLSSDGVVEGGTGVMHKNEQGTSAVVSIEKVKKNIAIGGAVVVSATTIGMLVLKAISHHMGNKDINSNTNKKKSKFGWILGGITLAGVAYTAYINAKRKDMLQDNFVNDDVTDEVDNEKDVNVKEPERVLITGANSYIGMSVQAWLNKTPEYYIVDAIDMMGDAWKECDFSQYDVVYHVAGIAHADVGLVTEKQKQLYYKVNTDLAVEVAKKAKEQGVKQFIFMSSMIVYSGCKEKIITPNTEPKPLNFYGDSKWQADQKVRELSDDTFKVVVLRPPMIYGKESKGNYPELAKLAKKLPVFPVVKNKRSMLHIDNLCQFVKLMIDNEEEGIFFPQNAEYTNTSDMVQMIASVTGRNIIMIPFANIPVKMLGLIPGKFGRLATKAFGDSIYDMSMSEYKENYRIRTLFESVQLTER